MTQALFDQHRPTLDRAVTAIRDRGFWSLCPEQPSPKDYGDTGANPAANASHTDAAFVASRFRVVQRRYHV